MGKGESINRITMLLDMGFTMPAVWGGNGGCGYDNMSIVNEGRLEKFRRELLGAEYIDLEGFKHAKVLYDDFYDFVNPDEYAYAAQFKWPDGLVLQMLYW